jgi:molybdopterin converting factor subunit 1
VISSNKVQVRLLFFASIKDIVGARQIDVEIPAGTTVRALLEMLEKKYPRLAGYRSILLTSVNEEYANPETTIADGDEVGVFPPVSGGAVQSEFYRVTHDVIDARAVAAQLQRPEAGAICIFEGIVRNNSKGKTTRYLEYEGYETMALSKMEEIGVFVRQAWEIDAVGIVHRLGRLEIGETSVAIIVTSAHRRASFSACEYAIDKLKKIVPIWKKEFFEDGEVWIEGQT